MIINNLPFFFLGCAVSCDDVFSVSDIYSPQKALAKCVPNEKNTGNAGFPVFFVNLKMFCARFSTNSVNNPTLSKAWVYRLPSFSARSELHLLRRR